MKEKKHMFQPINEQNMCTLCLLFAQKVLRESESELKLKLYATWLSSFLVHKVKAWISIAIIDHKQPQLHFDSLIFKWSVICCNERLLGFSSVWKSKTTLEEVSDLAEGKRPVTLLFRAFYFHKYNKRFHKPETLHRLHCLMPYLLITWGLGVLKHLHYSVSCSIFTRDKWRPSFRMICRHSSVLHFV